MIKLGKLAVMICLWGCFQTHPASACKYNVRDTGFVDLGAEPYYLYGYVNQDTPVDITSSFTQISYAALMDSNIKVEIINADQQKNHPAMKYLDLWSIQSFPAAVLVSPRGQSLLVPVTKPNQPFKQTLWLALDDILSSPKREEILQQVSEAYGVVLLIEGTEPEENKRAQEAASGAIGKISMQMKFMPKSIAGPPVLIVIEPELFSSEKILLWSLGLDIEKVSKPYAAVLYGRARLMGPSLKGETITETTLTNILYVIGADCECELDRRWMQGIMLPVRWDKKMQARVAKTLEFDPENPMVKMEISRILRWGLITNRNFEDLNSPPSVPLGYQELVIEFESVPDVRQIPPDQVKNTITPKPDATEPIPGPLPLGKSKPALQKPLYLIAALAILIITVGLFIVFRAARKIS